jgi:hypothetical protein
MFTIFVVMMILTIGSLSLISFYLLLGKSKITREKSHTKNMRIEDTPGNNEPHV